MKTLVFFGDSNTYGYDPSTGRGSGDCYPDSVRWIGLIKQHYRDYYHIYEEGKIGRCIPSMKYEYDELTDILSKYDNIDYFIVMLGTNDCLSFPHPDSKKAGNRMDFFVNWLKRQEQLKSFNTNIIIMAPPYMDFTGDRFYEKYSTHDGSLSRELEIVAERQNSLFIDTGLWNIPCCDDHVHLTKEGHRIFADNLIKELDKLISK